jgi:hypothetical protein
VPTHNSKPKLKDVMKKTLTFSLLSAIWLGFAESFFACESEKIWRGVEEFFVKP